VRLWFSARRKDFRIDTFSAGGKGGQHQNKTQSGVRITHVASGISAECREHREQLRNRKEAFRKVCERLLRWLFDRERVNHRQTTIVRTYDEKRNEVRDHRTGDVAPMDQVLDGDLEWFIG
jgi:peptide chain release factor 1